MGARGLYPEGWKEKAQDLSFLLESGEENPQLLTSACPVFHLTPTPHTRLLAVKSRWFQTRAETGWRE